VAAVDSVIDPTTAMVKLKATFDNADNALFPSQFVNMRLLVKTIRDVVIVPTDAVQRGPDNAPFVYVVKKTDAPATAPAADPAPQTDAPAALGGKKSDQPVSIVEVRNITTNPEVDAQGSEQTVVVSGVSQGEVVVTSGLDRLQAGSKVFAKIAATSQPSGSTTRGSHGGHGGGGHRHAATKPVEKDDQ
jgi:membrane fusion protein, multidrug efflux system